MGSKDEASERVALAIELNKISAEIDFLGIRVNKSIARRNEIIGNLAAHGYSGGELASLAGISVNAACKIIKYGYCKN